MSRKQSWLGRCVKAVEEAIRFFKHRVRVATFAIAAHALIRLWTARRPGTRVVIIADCFGRLANRLTVLANVLAYAQAENAIVLDLALRRHLNADSVRSEHRFAGCLLFADNSTRTWLSFLLVRVLRRSAREVERLSFASPSRRFYGIPLLRGERPNRVQLEQIGAFLRDDRCVVLTGVHIDAEPPAEETTDALRQIIRPNRQAVEFVDRTLAEIDRDRTVVGVHVRHGDYRHWQDGRFYYSIEEYGRCMHVIQQASTNPTTFLVVSDEEQDLSRCVGVTDVRRVYGSEDQDLALLARCDYIIASHSSFANWASFYGKVPILTARDGLGVAASPVGLDLGQLTTVRFPTLQSDYIIRLANRARRAA